MNSILIFLYSVLMVKRNFMNRKTCVINLILQFYRYQILFSIIFWMPFLMVLQLIDFIFEKKYIKKKKWNNAHTFFSLK